MILIFSPAVPIQTGMTEDDLEIEDAAPQQTLADASDAIARKQDKMPSRRTRAKKQRATRRGEADYIRAFE